MRFTQGQLDSFREYSFDRNPLHGDASYARKTEFGQCVVYGVASLIYGMGEWAQGRKFALKSLRAKFRKPLFLDEDYRYQIQDAGPRVEISVFKGMVEQSSFSFEWQAWSESAAPGKSTTGFVPLPGAAQFTVPGCTSKFSPHAAAEADFYRCFGLSPGQLPASQLSALLWASYVIGMEYPGRQALFVSLGFKFDDAASGEAAIELSEVQASFDSEFHLAAIEGKGSGIQNFTLNAFARPEPVSYSAANIAAVLGNKKSYADKSVFISGASRGFGSVLARAFALEGARVGLNYRTGAEDAQSLEREIVAFGGRVTLFQGDVANPADCARMAGEVEKRLGPIDLLVHNAFPAIRASSFAEQGAEDFLAYVQAALKLSVGLTEVFLPLLRASGVLLHVSTLYTQNMLPEFSHYLTAKCALEGFFKALAQERRGLNFVIVRPPRMLTDQTNTVASKTPPVSAIEVARGLLEAVSSLPAGRNLHEVNL